MITRKNAWMWAVGALVVVLVLFLALRKLLARRGSGMPVVSYSEPPMYTTRGPMMEDDSDDEDEEEDEEEDDDMVFDTGAPVMPTGTPTIGPNGMPMMWPVSA